LSITRISVAVDIGERLSVRVHKWDSNSRSGWKTLPNLRGQKGSGKKVWNQHPQPMEQSSRNSAQCDLF